MLQYGSNVEQQEKVAKTLAGVSPLTAKASDFVLKLQQIVSVQRTM